MTTHLHGGHRVLVSLVLAFTCFRLMSQTPLNPPPPPTASIPAAEAWLAGAELAPEFRVPATREAWSTRRAEIRTTLEGLLGHLPPRPTRPVVTTLLREDRGEYRFVGVHFHHDLRCDAAGCEAAFNLLP